MANPIDASNAVGTDGKVPLYNPDEGWRWWALPEVYLGKEGYKKHIPKVNDFVVDYTTWTTYIVLAIDETTLIPTLKQIHPFGMSYTLTQADTLFGVGPGTQADTYRLYVNKNEFPYTGCVDQCCWVGGSNTAFARVFKGVPEDPNAKVISKIYDAQGRFVTDRVSLENLTLDTHINYNKRTVKPFQITEDLENNEILTVVFYSNTGIVVSKRQVLVENTTAIKAYSDTTKYVTSIQLKSSFQDKNSPDRILYPLNVPINSLNLTGVVTYSDASTIELPVDGTKFSIFGLESYLPTLLNQTYDIVLCYNLSPSEACLGATSQDGKAVTRPYTIKTVNPNNSYVVKLFGYPQWVNAATGYKMRWYLISLERDRLFDVTDLVMFSKTTGSVDPKGYGYIQKKSIYLNLRDVEATWKPFIHTQQVEVELLGPPGFDKTLWRIAQEVNVNKPKFGEGVYVKLVENMQTQTLKVDCGLSTKESWLEAVYRNTQPLYDPQTETKAPEPTHFSIGKNDNHFTYGVDEWDRNLLVPDVVSMYDNINIVFYRRTGGEDLLLGVAAMTVTVS